MNQVPYNKTQDVRQATTAVSDPAPSCDPAGGHSVWYRYTPTIAGSLLVNTFGSDYDTVLSIWTGTRNNLAEVGCNDDSNSGTQSSLNVAVQAGTPYFIEITSYDNDEAGTLRLAADFAPANVIQNGDFEQGATVGWQQFSSNGWPLILSNNDLPVAPRNGTWASWLGGDHDEISAIWQEVTVPTTNADLHFWYWIASEDGCGFDFGGVVVDNSIVVDVFDLCSITETNGWVQRIVDLSDYAGQTIELDIRAETDGSLVSSLYVDDVTLGTAVIVTSQNSKAATMPELLRSKSTQLPPILKDKAVPNTRFVRLLHQ